jgi:5-oxoprolinase (ATP-hydrolysing)
MLIFMKLFISRLTDRIFTDYIRLLTTAATNPPLKRKCHKHALFVFRDFEYILLVGNQSTPKLFYLNHIQRPTTLYSIVLEVDKRVTLAGYTSDPNTAEQAIAFGEDGKVSREYRGRGWDGQGDTEGPGEVARWIAEEAVRISTSSNAT